MLRAHPGSDSDEQASQQRQLSDLGIALRNVRRYYGGLPAMGQANQDLSEFFEFDKKLSLKNDKRLNELLYSERSFFKNLALISKGNTNEYNSENNPREELISLLFKRNDPVYKKCIFIFQALRDVQLAVQYNLSSLERVFEFEVGTPEFNKIFLEWVHHLPIYINNIAPAAGLIESYQQIDPNTRRLVSRAFKDLNTGSDPFIESYLIAITQRIAKYHLLLRDICSEFQKSSKRQSFHLIYDDLNGFLGQLKEAIELVIEATNQANRALMPKEELNPDVELMAMSPEPKEAASHSPKMFRTAKGRIKIYESPESRLQAKRKQLLALRDDTNSGLTNVSNPSFFK